MTLPIPSGEEGQAAAPRRSWLARLNEFFELVVKIGLVAAGVVAVFQYFEGKQDKRVERTLTYATRFQEPPLLPAQQSLTALFRDQARVAASLSAAGLTRDQAREQEEQFVTFLRNEANGSGVENEIDLIVGFMDNVNNCITANLCDREVALRYFGPFAAQLFENLGVFIGETRRMRAPGYAAGLEALAHAQQELPR